MVCLLAFIEKKISWMIGTLTNQEMLDIEECFVWFEYDSCQFWF